MLTRRRLLLGTAGLVAASCAGAQGSGALDGSTALYARPGTDEWPDEFRTLPADVQEMYRYAVRNEQTLKWMPCTCGCVAGGHKSNFDCYVRAVLPDGRVELDTMSFG